MPVVNQIKMKLDEKNPLEASRIGKCGNNWITTPSSDREIGNIYLENSKEGG